MTRFCSFFNVAASTGVVSTCRPVMSAATAAAPAAIVPRNVRRCMACSGEPQKLWRSFPAIVMPPVRMLRLAAVLRTARLCEPAPNGSIIEPELRAGQQRPHQLPARLGRPVVALVKVVAEHLHFLFA